METLTVKRKRLTMHVLVLLNSALSFSINFNVLHLVHRSKLTTIWWPCLTAKGGGNNLGRKLKVDKNMLTMHAILDKAASDLYQTLSSHKLASFWLRFGVALFLTPIRHTSVLVYFQRLNVGNIQVDSERKFWTGYCSYFVGLSCLNVLCSLSFPFL